MARLKVAAAGSAEKNINRIDGRFQAEALRFLRGFDTGRLKNTFYSDADPTGEERDDNPNANWKIGGKTVDDITVGPGMATAYGYDILNEETVHLKADRSKDYRGFYIYLEWDFSNPEEAVGKIDIHYGNGPEDVWTRRMDNLITNPNGIYQMIIASVEAEEDGTIHSIRDWGFTGTSDWWQTLYAINSGHAVRSEYAQYAEGKSDKTIGQYLGEIYDRLEKLGRQESEAIINKDGSEPTITFNSLKKCGKFVLFNFKIWCYNRSTLKVTFPEGFKPKEELDVIILGATVSSSRHLTISSDGFNVPGSGSNECGVTLQNIGWEVE